MHAQDWFMVFIGFFLPPVPVIVKRGFFSADLLINVVLCILGYFPGLLHLYYIILCYPHRTMYARLGGDGHNHRVNNYGSTH